MRGSRPFRDRTEAGRALAVALGAHRGRDDVVVLALPRGGVPVAHEVAAALGAPLDVLGVRKLGVPGHTELAMGAIATGGTRVLNLDVVRSLSVAPEAIDEAAMREQAELDRRQRLYRGDRPFPAVGGRVVILVDDGLATGATMRAAIEAVRSLRPSRVVVAVPVGAPSTCRDLGGVADEVVCARRPDSFLAVSQWYLDFASPTDGEIRGLLGVDLAGDETMADAGSASWAGSPTAPAGPADAEEDGNGA